MTVANDIAKTCGLALAMAGTLLLASVDAARADANWKSSSAVWQQRDRCTRAAQKQFPDYTREANAKREAARQACLRASAMPTEAGPAPAQTAEPSLAPQR